MTAMYQNGDGMIWNQGPPGYYEPLHNTLAPAPGSASMAPPDYIIKFVLTKPSHSYLLKPEYIDLFEQYRQLNGVTEGISFTLYALVQNLTESVEHAITNRRSKGGFVENHWGPKPSVISISGQSGVFLSRFGLTSLQTEDPYVNPETVLTWDPSASVVVQNTTKQATANAGFLANLENAGTSLLKDFRHPSVPMGTILPSIDQSQAARVGTNLAFKKFRMLLDLFKMNGVVFDNIPNPDIYPSTFVAPNPYVDAQGKLHGIDPKTGIPTYTSNSPGSSSSLVNSTPANGFSDATLDSLRQSSMIAPGNVRATLPIEMWVKNTRYTGFFETFTYQFSEDNPFTVHYDLTFRALKTERMAIFYPQGTAGKKPYALIINPNKPAWSR